MEEYFIKSKSSYEKILDLVILSSVFLIVIFLLLELAMENGAFKTSTLSLEGLNEVYYYVSIFIFVVFLLDLLRLRKQSANWEDFFKNYWLDIIATIPLNLISSGTVQEILKLARVPRLLKLKNISKTSKVLKQFKSASKAKQYSEDYMKNNRL